MLNQNHHYAYQPIVDMQNLALVRYEALLRVPGVTNIEDYIKSLEASGDIIDLDLNTIEAVIRESGKLELPSKYPVAVNISAISINNKSFQERALKMLGERSVSTPISLEITETSPIKNIKHALNFVRNLHRAGCTVGMDDYGDGHANLDLIEDLGLDYIKLSSCITRTSHTNAAARNLCRNAIRVANEQCVDVVAEYIDDKEQYELLRDMGVHMGQGWLFGKAAGKIENPMEFETGLRESLK